MRCIQYWDDTLYRGDQIVGHLRCYEKSQKSAVVDYFHDFFCRQLKSYFKCSINEIFFCLLGSGKHSEKKNNSSCAVYSKILTMLRSPHVSTSWGLLLCFAALENRQRKTRKECQTCKNWITDEHSYIFCRCKDCTNF